MNEDDFLVDDLADLVSFGEAADSGEAPDEIVRLPRLLRALLGAAGQRPAQRERVLADIASLAPNLAPAAVAWVASNAAPEAMRLAERLDEAAAPLDAADLRSLADCVRVLSLPVDDAYRAEYRRVNLALVAGAASLDDNVPLQVRASIDTAIVGWAAVAAGVAPSARRRFTHAVDLAMVLGRARTTSIVKAALVEDEREREALASHPLARVAPVSSATTLPPVPPGHVRVCDPASKPGPKSEILRRYEKALVGPMQLVRTPDLTFVRQTLVGEFPYAIATVERILGEFAGTEHVHIRPTLLVGPPGCGKTRLWRRLSEVLGVGLWRVDATSSDAGSFGGTAQRWSTAEPAHPVLAMLKARQANGLILLDEVDKAQRDDRYGRLWDALLTVLEPESAARWMDPALQIDVDLSHLGFVATANSVASLPQPLLDRLSVLSMPMPERRHLDLLVPAVLAQVGAERGLAPAWIAPLSPEEHALVARVWKGGSLRALRRALDAVLRARDRPGVRH